MSSRVFEPDGPRSAGSFVWRQVAKAAAQTAAGGPAEGISKEASHQWEQRIAEARAAGVREGEAAGRSRASAEMQAALERLAQSVQEMASLRSRLRREAEADTVKLALAIARRVIRR